MAFTHLHVHTNYSLLDGAADIKKIVARAKELGMDSLAITDHGAMFGVVDFYKECKAQGVHPVIGCEVYTAERSLEDKDPAFDKNQGHLILLAKDQKGYENLMKIVSTGYTQGFYYKPRIDKGVLREHSEGIIALSACLAGDVQRKLLIGNYDGAKKEALDFLEIFGRGNFYLEVQDQGLEEEAQIRPLMKKLHEDTQIPLVATNDVHYVNREDAEAHDILLCIQTATTVDDESRMRFPNDQFYLKSEEEMRKLFADMPEACDNTHKIAMACNVEFEFGKLHLPEFKAPNGKSNEVYLRELCEKGLDERYGKKAYEMKERLDYELSIIESMGYVEYFLIVWDFINYARNQGIMVGPGRGSAAGSIVAYVLKITNIDPIKYNLIFERFLNPERVSMPDIDIDFCYERRGEVIDYVIEKYGEEKVVQIITFGTLKARAAVRDVGRSLNVSYGETDTIAKAIPTDLNMTIEKALKMSPDLADMYENNPQAKKVLDMAKALEGTPRHASTHAAGVVISKNDIVEYVPLYLADKGISTQFPMTTIEELGLLKMDFLGLRNLTVIRDALEAIEKSHGVTLDFENMNYDDPEVYKTIAAGNTQGIFQLESSGMTQFMKNLKPDCFEDIVAGISLYRPGPMASIPTYIANKKNPEQITYLHEKLRPILSVTYGCIVYQEQVMQIVRELAGYTYGRSDLLRRAMSKKKKEVMLSEKEIFLAGCKENGVSKEVAEEVFNQMVSFAEYAFNKSHAAAYAVVGYETGYLKVHYPVEFMAALMSSVMGDAAQISKYIRNCTEMDIKVLPPDINTSEKKFTAMDGEIRFGLMGVKNVGEGVIDAIIEARENHGSFDEIQTFINSVDIRKINKKAVESLIKAGALDSLKGNRAQHLAVYERLIESAQAGIKNNIEGQISFFQSNEEEMKDSGWKGTLPHLTEFSKEILSAMEKEMLGVYLTDHPLNAYRDSLEKRITVTSADLEDEEAGRVRDGDTAVMAGIIAGKRNLITKNNQQMAFLRLEDFYGEVEVIVFPNTYEKWGHLLTEDGIIAVKGRINFKEEESPKLIAQTITDVRSLVSETDLIKVRIPADQSQEKTLNLIRDLLADNRGGTPVVIYLHGNKVIRTSRELRAEKSDKLKRGLAKILGAGNVKM